MPSSNGRIVPTGGMTANITINAVMGSDPNAISRAVVEALQRYQRTNGTIPVRTLSMTMTVPAPGQIRHMLGGQIAIRVEVDTGAGEGLGSLG